ncbi:hypothetical protein ABZT03_35370 [Streptomyces sp. NPDC005574]|uniref:hypothetical protein n=1 Tax=Streptomyces sp. NPDC005574 TaxID=3156891 RepID=UPI0033AF1284
MGATLRLAARWVRAVPRAEWTGQWIALVEGRLTGAVEDEHTGYLALHAVAERVRAQMRAADLRDGDATARHTPLKLSPCVRMEC